MNSSSRSRPGRRVSKVIIFIILSILLLISAYALAPTSVLKAMGLEPYINKPKGGLNIQNQKSSKPAQSAWNYDIGSGKFGNRVFAKQQLISGFQQDGEGAHHSRQLVNNYLTPYTNLAGLLKDLDNASHSGSGMSGSNFGGASNPGGFPGSFAGGFAPGINGFGGGGGTSGASQGGSNSGGFTPASGNPQNASEGQQTANQNSNPETSENGQQPDTSSPGTESEETQLALNPKSPDGTQNTGSGNSESSDSSGQPNNSNPIIIELVESGTGGGNGVGTPPADNPSPNSPVLHLVVNNETVGKYSTLETPNRVAEPSTILLFVLGALGLLAHHQLRKSHSR